MPLLACPHCGQKVSVAISQAGAEVACSGCQQTIPVPKLGELKRLAAEQALGSEQPQPLPSDNFPATDQTGRRVLFGGLLAIAGIAAIAGLFCVVRYLSVEVPATTEMHIAEIDRLYRQSPAAHLVGEWEELEKLNLEFVGPFAYKKMEKDKARWGRNSLLAGSVLALSVTAAMFLGFGERRQRAV
jgi:hypothetical protein